MEGGESTVNQPTSCRRVANDSRIGINGSGGSTENQPPSCRIVAIGSRIGDNEGEKPTINQPPSSRIVANSSRIGAIGGGEGWDENRNLLGIHNSSNKNLDISKGSNNNNLNINHNNNSVGGNNQFPSRCESGHSDQLSRFKHENNTFPHIQYGEVRLDRHGEHGGVGQFQPHPNRYKSDLKDQSPDGIHVYRKMDGRSIEVTPMRREVVVTKRKLQYSPV